MCSVNIPKTVSIWAEDFQTSVSGSVLKGTTRLSPGTINSLALQEFVEKVIIFSQAESGATKDPKVAALLFLYASLLAAEGELQAASRYIVGQTDEACAILRDRLFHASQEQGNPPPFPFSSQTVSVGSVTPATLPHTESFWGVPSVGSSFSRGIFDASPQLEFQNSKSSTNAAVGVPESPPLPLGWTKVYDPSRQAYYYYNKVMNVSQWETPVPQLPVLGSSASLGAMNSQSSAEGPCTGIVPLYGQRSSSNVVPHSLQNVDAKPMRRPGPAQMNAPFDMKSGPSPGHPTSGPSPGNPLPTSQFTTTAGSSSSGVAPPSPASPPVQVLTPAEAIDACVALGGDTAVVVQAVQSLTGTLNSMQLSPPQRKMLSEVSKASHILFCKAVAGDVEPDVMEKVSRFFNLLSVRDMHGATAVHQVRMTGVVLAVVTDPIRNAFHKVGCSRR